MPMDIKLSVSVAIIAAVILGELLSFIWYSNTMSWGNYGQRYWLTAIVADVGLAFILQHVARKYWPIRRYDDAAWLSLWLAVLYFFLEAPHVVYGPRTLVGFFWHTVHKFALMFVMTLALYHFKNY